MSDEAKEARVFVRDGTPWIDSICPTCGGAVLIPRDRFCPSCGQKLSFRFYYKVLDTGGNNIPTAYKWREVTPEELELVRSQHNIENFTRRLKLLEKEFGIEEFDTKDHPLLRIMRKTYVETCFEEKFKCSQK